MRRGMGASEGEGGGIETTVRERCCTGARRIPQIRAGGETGAYPSRPCTPPQQEKRLALYRQASASRPAAAPF